MTEPKHPNRRLTAALTALSAAIGVAGSDLTNSLAALTEACRIAVDSYIGLSVHTTIGARTLGFTTVDEHEIASVVTTSLRLELHPSQHDEHADDPQIVLTMYANTPGAFVDLAADLTWLLGQRVHSATLDEDLTWPSFEPLDITLSEMSDVDQAIGVLIGRGNSPEQARQALSARAAIGGLTIHAQALQIIGTLDTHPDGSDGDG